MTCSVRGKSVFQLKGYHKPPELLAGTFKSRFPLFSHVSLRAMSAGSFFRTTVGNQSLGTSSTLMMKLKSLFCRVFPCHSAPKENQYEIAHNCRPEITNFLSFEDKINAYILLVFSVTPFKIDQNENHSTDKVQNLGNVRR